MKKNNVGIITFHNSYNCGSMLQSYALQKVLNLLNVKNEIIDFSNDGQREVYSLYDHNKTIKSFIKNIIVSLYRKRIIEDFNNYEMFKNNIFKLSEKKYNNSKELSDECYDIVITGSDQVWNITIKDGDEAYFLPWVKNAKKIAYSPSFGSKSILKYADNTDKYVKMINDFNYVSTRENNGKKWIKDLTGKDVPVLLDPTLLLAEKEYDVIEDKNIKIPKKYIFYYSPSFDYKINKLVKKISTKYKLPVIAFNSKNYYVKGMNFKGFKQAEYESPSVYLHLIKNATLIITTSFHGTIFSTIYRKKFWTIKNGAMLKDDDRVLTLMNNLDLIDRLIPIQFNKGFDYLKEKSYLNYEKELKIMQTKSIEYLKRCVE